METLKYPYVTNSYKGRLRLTVTVAPVEDLTFIREGYLLWVTLRWEEGDIFFDLKWGEKKNKLKMQYASSVFNNYGWPEASYDITDSRQMSAMYGSTKATEFIVEKVVTEWKTCHSQLIDMLARQKNIFHP